MLSAIQERVAALLADLPEAEGFALAGGAALIVRGDVDRLTSDLDFFAAPDGRVDQLTAAFVAAAQEAGFGVESLQSGPTFARVLVRRGEEAVSVDVGLDARIRPLEASRLGPVLSREELAADKLLALFGRAEPRDFVDVMALEPVIGLERMCDLAAEKDRGFSRVQLAAMIERFDRFSAEEYGGDRTMLEQLRAATHRWLDQLGVEPPDRPWRGPGITPSRREGPDLGL